MKTTAEVKIPKDMFFQVIGQDNAVQKARICVKQRRHLLLIGPPGTGKSMIARSMASILPKPKQEVVIANNKNNPERPFVIVRNKSSINNCGIQVPKWLKKVEPIDVPYYVAESLGFRCRRCGKLSDPEIDICPYCYAEKKPSLIVPRIDKSVEINLSGRSIIYMKMRENKRYGLKKGLYCFPKDKSTEFERLFSDEYKIIIPFDRNRFVQVVGGSETELLGDVEHDPYGTSEAGSLPYKRVVPGAIHEAHEGILFIDEISALGDLQKHLLTAMQEKRFPIVGRNPTSSGAAVKADNVPCDFILVVSANMSNLDRILPSLRSRITGNGYEVVMNTWMDETEENKNRLIQFIAQEIKKDGRIPHMTMDGVEETILFAKKIAKDIDRVNGYTLRLRIIAGLIRAAGDIAVLNNSQVIEKKHITDAIKSGLSADETIRKTGDNWFDIIKKDYAIRQHETKDVL